MMILTHLTIIMGERGIEVSKEWRESFKQFINDVGEKPTPHKEYSIDRIDNDKGYSKENCRWATRKEQQNNRRVNRKITFNKITKTIAEWAEETGLSVGTITKRNNTGWEPCEILSKPVKELNYYLELENRKVSEKEFAEYHKINIGTFRQRLSKGWSVDEALSPLLPREVIANNNTHNRKITAFGRTQNLGQWAKEYNISREILAQRLNGGMNSEEALTTPVKELKLLNYELNGNKVSEKEFAEYHGIKLVTFRKRIESGWSISDAIKPRQTPLEISSKRKDLRMITAFGKTKSVSDWCRETGLQRKTILHRIDKYGWSEEQALSPVKKKNQSSDSE